ncbi:MAG TPA: DedA family protein [Candidatus Paceibacterota bacterium]|nr:DedA family protein [Candidatus Paceibacterota bacterium]
MPHIFEILPLIETIGLIGVFLFIFAESGLFFGFFLPGDSLLFTAGILASAGHFNIAFLFFGAFICAFLGDTVGYWFGKKVGPRIFTKPNSFFWNKKNIEKTANFFEKHGDKTITLARFVPIVRTFAPIMAGVGQMKYKKFFFWNILGGLVWTGSMTFGGYFLGSYIDNVDRYILPIVLAIIFVSFIPVGIQFLKRNKNKTDNMQDGVQNFEKTDSKAE